MARFSNSDDGMVFDEQCLSCIHGWDWKKEENRPGYACPIWILQATWNYSQHSNPDQAKALDMLVPNKDDIVCALYVGVGERNFENFIAGKCHHPNCSPDSLNRTLNPLSCGCRSWAVTDEMFEGE